MILNLKDKRKFTGNSDFQGDSTKPVIVLEESKTGRNELFYDTNNQKAMSRSEFVRLIKEGSYPGYRVVNLYGKATPISVPDGDPGNNLS